MIDLGEMSAAAADDLSSRPWISASTWRSLAVAVLVLACLTGVSASVQFERPWTEPLWTGQVGQNDFSLGARHAYAVAANGQHAIAYDIATGAVRWQAEIGRGTISIHHLGASVVAVLTQRLRRGPDKTRWSDVRTVLLDDETGVRIATVRGVPVGRTPSGRLLMLSRRVNADGVACLPPEPVCLDLAAVHARTGERLWQIAVTDMLTPRLVGDQRTLIIMDTFLAVAPAGKIAVHDAESATVLDQLTVPGASSEGQFRVPGGPELSLVGDAIVSAAPFERGVQVTRYPLASHPGKAAPVGWSRLVPPAASDGQRLSSTGVVYGCGLLLCLDLDNRGVVIEPDTGVVRTVVSGQVAGHVAGGHLLTVQSRPLPGTPTRYRQAVEIVDYRNGGTLAVFPSAATVPWLESAGLALVAQQGEQTVGFIVIDDVGRPFELGSVPGANLSCRARAEMLACSDPAGTLTVWRLPAAGEWGIARHR